MKCENGHTTSRRDSFCTDCGIPTKSDQSWKSSLGALYVIAALVAIAVIGSSIAWATGNHSSSRSSVLPDSTTTTTTTTTVQVPSTTTLPRSTTTVLSGSRGTVDAEAVTKWQANLSVRSKVPKTSPIVVIGGIPTVVTGDEPTTSSSNLYTIAIWEFTDSYWAVATTKQLAIPISSIKFLDLSGDSYPDVVVDAVGGYGPTSFVLTRSQSEWQIIPWGPSKTDSPGGQLSVDGLMNIYVTSRDCTPSCASGGSVTSQWEYDRTTGTFLKG